MSPRGAEVIVHQAELELGVGDVVGEVEIGARLGVQPQTVAQWRIRSKGKHGTDTRAGRRAFPEPRWPVSGLPAWYWPEVEAWAKRTGRLPEDPPAPRPGQSDTPRVRLVGGLLSGQIVEHPDAGKARITIDAARDATLADEVAGVIPVRCDYRRSGLPDPDGTVVYLHHLTTDLLDAR